MKARNCTALAAVAALWLFTGVAQATVITFSPLTGSNADPYSGHSEAGFDIGVVSGEWLEAHVFGNPTPDIFGRSSVGTIAVTEGGGGLFTFLGVDLSDALDGGADYQFEGLLGGVSQFVQTGFDLPGSFLTIASISNSVIDRLEITMFRNVATYNIDNIEVIAVSEPGVPALITAGLILIGVAKRKTSRA